MPDKTIKQRKARLLERDRSLAFIPVQVRVPKARREELIALCKEWRRQILAKREADAFYLP